MRNEFNELDIQNGVLIGKGGYLFLADGGHHILEVVTGRRPITSETLQNFRHNLIRRSEYVLKFGAAFLHVIFPDKQSILTEFPISNPICLGNLQCENAQEAEKYLFYPLDLLKSAARPVFQKADTHMTDYGTAICTVRLVELLTGDDQSDHLAGIIDQINVERLVHGDLGLKLDPPRSSTECFLVRKWPIQHFHNNLKGGNNGIVDILFSKNAVYAGRILWFGDSFGRGCLQILSYFFREIVFLRTGFFHPEIFDQIKPDIVITQNVERYLDVCESDDRHPPFFLYPHLAGLDYRPSREFAEAFSAMLSYPREPYQQYIDNIFGKKV